MLFRKMNSFSDDIRACIRRAVPSEKEVLHMTTAELSQKCNLSLATCHDVHVAIAQAELGRTLQMNQKDPWITSITSLDSLLRGGIEPGWLVELCGPAGSGKTQICLSLASNAIREGKSVYWIDSGKTFRPERLVQIAGYTECLNNVHVAPCHCLFEALRILSTIDPIVRADPNTPMVIIDSVASLARSAPVLFERHKQLHDLAGAIKRTPAITVVTNHVRAELSGREKAECVPALGNTWSHDITCRFMLGKEYIEERQTRWIEVLKSPRGIFENHTVFNIGTNGVY
jgi:energy-coupling factor transporter ATP-binding protein EcfA2